MDEKKIEDFDYDYHPSKLNKWQSFQLFVWNPETKQFCRRTADSWAKIGLFYLIFYGVLAAFVAIYMWLFLLTLDTHVPKWQLERSIIGTNPGLGFRPMYDRESESTLIRFQGYNTTSYKFWVDKILNNLEPYYNITPNNTNVRVKTCNYQNLSNDDGICKVDVKDWGDCSKENDYSYHQSSPCIFLKLNKIYGWVPKYYDDPMDLPADMPPKLKHHIRSINTTIERQNVWVSCQGENPSDIENLGPISYFPKSKQGFSGYYFPYMNKVGYLSPLVAVKFEKPKHGVLISVECRAWAKNIKYNRAEKMGLVHFELLVD